MKIFYGAGLKFIDITRACLDRMNHKIIYIPSKDDTRCSIFTDPCPGVLKKIMVLKDNGTFFEYDHRFTLKINIVNQAVSTINDVDIENKLKIVHSTLKMKHGSMNDELPEQKMVLRYFTGKEKVLEIGSNTGRNSMVIARILGENAQFVTMESDPDIASQLRENRDLNGFQFHIENSALSKRKLIQQNWFTKESEVLLDGHKWVNTITFDDLKSKYNIDFDTLVFDCEGAFYYILMDMPEILENIKLIVMENDYFDPSHKTYIDNVLKKNRFYVDYVESGGWGFDHYSYANFFQVWKRQE